jgi:hypothetical protein
MIWPDDQVRAARTMYLFCGVALSIPVDLLAE